MVFGLWLDDRFDSWSVIGVVADISSSVLVIFFRELIQKLIIGFIIIILTA